jgi:hypothetical protein
MVLLPRVHPTDPVDEALEWPEDRVEERSLPIEHPCHIDTQGADEQHDEPEEQGDLEDAMDGHKNFSLKPLRAQQRVDEIDEPVTMRKNTSSTLTPSLRLSHATARALREDIARKPIKMV